MDEELLMLHGDKHIKTSVLLKRTWKYIKSEMPRFIGAIILTIFYALANAFIPMLIQMLIDLFKNEDPSKIVMSTILILTSGYLVFVCVLQFIIYIQSMTLQKAGQNIIYRLRKEVFTHIENMSINQFNEMPVGSLVTRVATYTTNMSEFFTNSLNTIVRSVLMIVSIYIVMTYYSWQLSLAMLGIIAIIFVITYIFTKMIHKNHKNAKKLSSILNAFLSENLQGMRITQLFNRQKYKSEQFFIKNEELRVQRYKIVKIFAIYRPLISFISIATIAMTFLLGVKLGLSAGAITAFYIYENQFFQPIQQLTDTIDKIQNALTASERLFNLLDVKPHSQDKENAVEIAHFKGKIEFKHVYFAYEKENWILKDVSFVINPGETAAFVGATGAGKTTILSLIVRNYTIQKGQILIDDIDINDIKVDCLRRSIGQMLQDVFLFSGTIKSNISLRDETFTDQEIIDACKYVNADSFIFKNEKGLDAEVSPKGENFSQGQRQLLSFARTILHKPDILILDEATANIDTETEKLIQNSLEKMKSIGTMLIVAHRLSTIQNADQIICLQNGEVVESGNHVELLRKRGYYYKLYLLQFSNDNK